MSAAEAFLTGLPLRTAAISRLLSVPQTRQDSRLTSFWIHFIFSNVITCWTVSAPVKIGASIKGAFGLSRCLNMFYVPLFASEVSVTGGKCFSRNLLSEGKCCCRDGEHKADSRQSIIPPRFLSYSPCILCQEWKVAGSGSARRWDRNAGPRTAVFVLVTQCAASGEESCRNTCSSPLCVVQAFLIFKGLVCRLVASVNISGCQTRSEAGINVHSGWEDKKNKKQSGEHVFCSGVKEQVWFIKTGVWFDHFL